VVFNVFGVIVISADVGSGGWSVFCGMVGTEVVVVVICVVVCGNGLGSLFEQPLKITLIIRKITSPANTNLCISVSS
jgi:hypothetical protein